MNQHPLDNSNSYSYDNNGAGKQTPPPIPDLPISENSEVEIEVEAERQERIRATQQSFKRFYFILLAIGLSIGAVLAVGVAILLDRFNLSDPPSRCDRSSIGCFRRTPPETIKYNYRV
jgi:hypothetical protein